MKYCIKISLIICFLVGFFVQLHGKEIETIISLQNENRSQDLPIDLHLSNAYYPIVNSTITLLNEDAWLFFDNVKPSLVIDKYAKDIKINGEEMNPFEDANCRIVVYKQGAVIIPHPNNYQALETFTEENFSGETKKYVTDQYYTNSPISDIPSNRVESLNYDNKIRSFKLKRGYMATFANEPDGMGYSRVFIADKEDIEISTLPIELDKKISFIRVFPWEWVSKKGWVGTRDIPQGSSYEYVDQQSDATNSTWYYTWGASVYGSSNATENSLINQQYVPEKWGKGGSIGVFYQNKRWSHLLGQNEPDHAEQSNVSVKEAVAEWPVFLKTGARLGAPATTNFTWLYQFMEQCEENNYRVDFVAVHAYWGGKSPINWYNDLKKIYENTGRLIWITEWNNGANWTNESWPSGTEAQQQKQLNDLKGILTVLDTTSFIERYSIYNWVEDKRAILLNGALTPAGEYYAADTSDFAFKSNTEVIPTWSVLSPKLNCNYIEEKQKINLSWNNTNGELANKYFIEQSFDQQNWVKINELSPTSGSENYELDVLSPNEIQGNGVYYRIRVFGLNNNDNTSNVVKYSFIRNKKDAPFTVSNIKVKEDKSLFFLENTLNSDFAIIAGPPTYRNRYPLTIRASSTNSKSFEMQLRTWSYLNDPVFHYPDTLAVANIVYGWHKFNDITLFAGKEVQVGKMWKTINFEHPFDVVPVVFATQITANDNNASAIRIKNITTTGFDICRKYEPAKQNVYEDISYVAATPGSGTIDAANKIEVGLTSEADGDSFSNTAKINYINSYNNPSLFGFMQTCNDEAPAILRIKSKGGNYAELFKEREKSTTTINKAEKIGWMVIGSTNNSTAINNAELDIVNDIIINMHSNTIQLINNQLMNKVEVYSVNGSKVLSESNVHSLNISSLQNGIYIAKVNSTQRIKFIKQ